MAKVSGIYVIVNTKNGKVYIGQAQDFHTRWCKHKRTLNSNRHDNRHLQAAWNKYGAKVFRFQELEYCSIEMLDEREQHYLDVYMPKGMCYNIAKDVKAPSRGIFHSEEALRKMRGHVVSEETRRKLSEAKRSQSEETRQKISKTLKGRKISEETRRKMSDANKNRSEDARRKMSESAIRAHARRRAEREALVTAQSEGLTP